MKNTKISINAMAVHKFAIILIAAIFTLNGCTPSYHARKADKISYGAIDTAKSISLGDDSGAEDKFTIKYKRIIPKTEAGQAYKLSLNECIHLALNNSLEYQSQKEELYKLALDYTTTEHEWGFFGGNINGLGKLERQSQDGEDTSHTGEANLGLSLTQKLAQGGIITLGVALDLSTDLLQFNRNDFGSSLSAKFTQPLLRGAWGSFAYEDLYRQRRDLIIGVYEFERHTQSFCTEVIAEYYGVLQDLDRLENERENIKRLQLALRRIGIQVEAGQAKRIEYDRAEQDLYNARKRLLSLKSGYQNSMDALIRLINLPADIQLQLNSETLTTLSKNELPEIPLVDTTTITEQTEKELAEFMAEFEKQNSFGNDTFSRQLRQELINRKRDEIYDRIFFQAVDIAANKAIKMALQTRPDVIKAMTQLRDSRKDIDVAANAFLPQLDLTTEISAGQTGANRTRKIDFGKYKRSVGLQLDYDFDQTENRSEYRKAIINYAKSQRNLLKTVRDTSQNIRRQYRTLIEKKRTYQLQTQSLKLAQRRQQLTALEQAEGRADAEEVLDAEEALRNAQNDLTSAAVDYNNTLLEFLASQGLLKIESSGEYSTRENPQLFDKIEKYYGSLDEAIKEASKAHFKD